MTRQPSPLADVENLVIVLVMLGVFLLLGRIAVPV
jgi:hypothetical protein